MGLERGIAANSRSKKIKSTLTTNSTTGNSEYVIGRVVDIVLNSEHPKFQDVGGYNGIGTIYYEINNKIGNSKFYKSKLNFLQKQNIKLVLLNI